MVSADDRLKNRDHAIIGRQKLANYNDLLVCQTCFGKRAVKNHEGLYEECESCGGTGSATVPECVDPARRESTKHDFLRWCTTYFRGVFRLNWSENHVLAADCFQKAVLEQGQFAFAMPRGSGKTSMCEAGVLWAVFHGHVEYAVIIGATEPASEERIYSFKVELSNNPMLLADFPEIVFPIHHLERGWRRVDSQTCGGVPTAITWKQRKIVLPTMPDSKASGSVIQGLGITSAIRGLVHKREDNTSIRPGLAVCDDPQTRESAKSSSQSELRAATLAGDVAYLSGPDSRTSVVVPCTIIYQDDMAFRMLDRDLHPEYRGFTSKMVNKFPKNETLWAEYEQILKDSMLNDGSMKPATDFYSENRCEMDLGSEVSWPERFNSDELSALQHAMNRKIINESAFWSECQNEPVETQDADKICCSPAEIYSKMSPYQRFSCPAGTEAVTAFIDVQKKCLYYVICGWQAGFSGMVMDYGVWPEQKSGRRSFGLASVAHTLEDEYGGVLEAQVFSGLRDLTNVIGGRIFGVDGGDEIRVSRILIDANWGQTSSSVYQFCRESTFGNIILPSHGRGVRAADKPWAEWKRKKHERVGPGWRTRPSEEWPIPHVIFDANWWKTFVHQRFKVQFGGRGCLSLYGKNASGRNLEPSHHLNFGDQVGGS